MASWYTQETGNLGQGPNPSLSIWSNCTSLLQSKIAGWKLPFWKWWCSLLCAMWGLFSSSTWIFWTSCKRLESHWCDSTWHQVQFHQISPKCFPQKSWTELPKLLLAHMHSEWHLIGGATLGCSPSPPCVLEGLHTGVVPSFSKTRSSDWGDEKLSGSRALFWSSCCW